MNISSVNSDLIRGNVTTIILGSLWSSDRYGYDILKEIETKSDGQYKIKQATLYNQLKKLEEQGLISSYDGDPDDTGGGKRKYFALTAEGRAFLKKEKTEYEYARTILDRLVSSQEFDFSAPLPFEASELRPYSKKNEEAKPKVVYKDKIIEKSLYFDMYGNEITKEEADALSEEAAAKEQERLIAEENARNLAEEREKEILSVKEELAKTQEELNAQKEAVRQKEAENAEYDRKIRTLEEEKEQTEENYRKSDEEKTAALTRLREIEDEKEKLAEEERIRKEEEERIKQEELSKPSYSVEQMFEKLDLESEYKEHINPDILPEKHYYINGYTSSLETESKAQMSLRDALIQLDEKASAMSVKEKENTEDSGDGMKVSLSRPDGKFAYENEDVNYREFFYSIKDQQENDDDSPQQNISGTDIKTRLYSKGFKIRPYDRGNTSEFYTFNFIHSNRLSRDTFLIILGIFALECGIIWASLATQVSYKYFLPVLIVGSFLCLIPLFRCLSNPSKRTRAKFNFKFSLLNTSMFWVELSVICILIGFFGFGAGLDDIKLILCSIVIPMILLTNIPVSSVVYWLLYKTRKYHTA